MNDMLRPLVLRAATVLEAEAELHRESCQIKRPGEKKPRDWQCADCELARCTTKARYEELTQLVTDLRAEARVSG